MSFYYHTGRRRLNAPLRTTTHTAQNATYMSTSTCPQLPDAVIDGEVVGLPGVKFNPQGLMRAILARIGRFLT